MPVYWFSVSFIGNVNLVNAILIFFILHVLIYPASNAYNSYMDRDEESIGGVKHPLQPTRQLFYVSVLFDVFAAVCSLMVSFWFALAVVLYIVCSRLYSYRGIRLKRFAIIGYLVVIANQGTLTFFMIYHGASKGLLLQVPWQGLLASAFLIGGFYPITQVYQHESDRSDGVQTISMLLGKKGTFVFCGLMYGVAFSLLFFYYLERQQTGSFLVLQLFFIPVIIFFIRWMLKVWRNDSQADFKHTMQMNWLASTCTSLAFITLIILQHIG